MFISQTQHENGEITIFRTDDEGEFIRHCVEDLINGFISGAQVTCTALGQDWYRIEVVYPSTSDPDEGLEAMMELSSILGMVNKGWYECREEDASPDGLTNWYVVRHRGGPYI